MLQQEHHEEPRRLRARCPSLALCGALALRGVRAASPPHVSTTSWTNRKHTKEPRGGGSPTSILPGPAGPTLEARPLGSPACWGHPGAGVFKAWSQKAAGVDFCRGWAGRADLLLNPALQAGSRRLGTVGPLIVGISLLPTPHQFFLRNLPGSSSLGTSLWPAKAQPSHLAPPNAPPFPSPSLPYCCSSGLLTPLRHQGSQSELVYLCQQRTTLGAPQPRCVTACKAGESQPQ